MGRLRALTVALIAGGVLGTTTACGGGGSAGPTQSFRGGQIAGSPPAPDFVLRDQAGKLVRLSSLDGTFRIVTFLYTRCPDVCPLIASNLGRTLRELGPKRSQVRVLAVSVDPRGDTPAAVRFFVDSHRLPSQFRYLTDRPVELRRVWRAYGVLADPDRTDKAITHSAFEILVDRSGRERLLYDAQVTPADLLHDLTLLMGET
jgi:protein SCO1/2